MISYSSWFGDWLLWGLWLLVYHFHLIRRLLQWFELLDSIFLLLLHLEIFLLRELDLLVLASASFVLSPGWG